MCKINKRNSCSFERDDMDYDNPIFSGIVGSLKSEDIYSNWSKKQRTCERTIIIEEIGKI